MPGSRTRTIAAATAVLEAGIAGWWAGDGLLWLLAATAAVTALECAWGIARRRAYGDIVGLEVAAALALLLLAGPPAALATMTAAACVAWLIRPGRDAGPARRAA
jgi:hypothetical protein